MQFMYVDCWAGVTNFCYAVLTSPNQDETAVHCCDLALSVLVMLVSRNVFHVVSALQSIFSATINFVCRYQLKTLLAPGKNFVFETLRQIH